MREDKIKIYIVENYMLTRIACKRYFCDEEEFNVTQEYLGGYACIERIGQIKADIVLIDADLPDIGGVDVAKFLKQKYPKTKTIFFSSRFDEKIILDALASGVCGFIVKNDESISLKKIVQVVMNGSLYIDLKIGEQIFSSLLTTPAMGVNKCECNYIKKSLTKREKEVLRLMIDGKTNSQIAREIIISTSTAKAHVGRILTKLSVKDRVQAVVKAVKADIL